MTDIIELAKKWFESEEGKQSLKDAIENAERMNQHLEKARQIPTHLMHEPFVPVLTKFAQLLQQGEPVAQPLRINLGFGKYGIHHGNIEDVPCLTISDLGTGVINEPTKHENMAPLPKENEVLSITFANKESYEVFKKEFDSIFTTPPSMQAKLDKAREALQYIETQTTEGWLLNVVQQALKDTE